MAHRRSDDGVDRVARMFVVAAAALGATVANAAAPDPAYLAEMPSVDRVQSTLQGGPPLDAATRQVCAFTQLFNVVHAIGVSQGRVSSGTPDEMRVAGAYSAALRNLVQTEVRGLTPEQRQNWGHSVQGCQDSPAFLDALFTQFNMPETRAAYGKANPSFAAAGHAPSAGSSLTAGGTTGAAGVGDPSVARARAAGVDPTILGLALGEPVQVPDCASVAVASSQAGDGSGGLAAMINSMVQQSGLQGQPVSAVCHSEQMDMTALASALLGQSQGSNTIIKYPPNKCPGWMTMCVAHGSVEDGLLESVVVKVAQSGPGDQTVPKLLIAKYGRPTVSHLDHFQNQQGSRVDMVDLEWVLPGVHVTFKPILLSQGTTNCWALRAETESVYRRNVDAQQKQDAEKQAL
jgi:hypothetical protein